VEARGEDVELQLVEGASHWLPEEHPELVASTARALFGRG
jgi:pimeloyl-ACP methyl ester carboxylesterase